MKKLIFMVAALALIASPALGADWNFYGHARISTFYSKIDKDPFANPTDKFFGGTQDTSNYEQNLHGNSRIGARVKVSDSVSGRFEFGALNGVTALLGKFME